MAFADELKAFAETFQKVYKPPSDAAVERARNYAGVAAGRAAADAADAAGRSPNLGTDWLGAAGGEGSNPGGYNPQGKLPTFARSSENLNTGDVIERAKQALGGMESGNRYGITGPVSKTGDMPYGRYQVMGANIPSWTEEALGRRLSKEEFLNSPEAQDRVFEHRFGNYVKQYGLENALSMWHSGVPLDVARRQGRRDVNMPTTQYVGSIMSKFEDGGTVQALKLQGGARIPEWAAVEDRVRALQPQVPVQTVLQALPVQAQPGTAWSNAYTTSSSSGIPAETNAQVQGVMTDVNNRIQALGQQIQGMRPGADMAAPMADWRNQWQAMQDQWKAMQAQHAQGVPLAAPQGGGRVPWQDMMQRWQEGAQRRSQSPWRGMGAGWGAGLKDTLKDPLNQFKGALSFERGGSVVGVAGNELSHVPTEAGEDADSYDTYDPKQLVQPDAIPDIIDQGMKYFQHVFGIGKSAIQGVSQQGQDASRAIQMNVGAATPEQVEQVANTIDPKRKLSAPERQIAMYKGMYDYWMNQGEPEKASRAVFALTMAAKEAANTYGTVAMQALQRGDTKVATDAIAKAYEQSPDGQTIKFTEVGPRGAKFELTDLNGNITEKGRMAMDEMIQTATGMQNGSAWLQAMGAIRTRGGVDKVAQRQAAEQKAYEEYQRARGGDRDERSFLSTLSPEAQEKFLKLPQKARDAEVREHMKFVEADRKQANTEYNQIQGELDRLQKQENRDLDREDRLQKRLEDLDFREGEQLRKQGNFETRMNNQTNMFEIRRKDSNDRWITARDDRLDAQARKERIDAFKTALRQGNWEDQRERQMSQFERKLAQDAQEASDRNARHNETREDRLQRHAEIDRRIMEDRKIQADRRAAGAAERAARPARQTEQQRREQRALEGPQAALNLEEQRLGQWNPEATPEEVTRGALNTMGPALAAERTASMAEATRKGAAEKVDSNAITEAIGAATSTSNIRLKPGMENNLSIAAHHLARANPNISESVAANMAVAALDPANPPKFKRDLTNPDRMLLQIGNTPPVVVGTEALNAIAMLRGQALAGYQPTPGDPNAVRTVSREEGLKRGLRSRVDTIGTMNTRATGGTIASPARGGQSGNPADKAEPGAISAANAKLDAQLRAAEAERLAAGSRGARNMQDLLRRRRALDLTP